MSEFIVGDVVMGQLALCNDLHLPQCLSVAHFSILGGREQLSSPTYIMHCEKIDTDFILVDALQELFSLVVGLLSHI